MQSCFINFCMFKFFLRSIKLVFGLIVSLLLALTAWAAANAEYWNASPVNLLSEVTYLEDAQMELNIEDVRQLPPEQFRPLQHANFGYSSSRFWLRIPLQHTQDGLPQKILELAHFDISELVLHVPNQTPIRAGLDVPLNDRLWPHRFYAFPLMLSEHLEYYYLEVRSKNAIVLPLTLWEPTDFMRYSLQTNLWQALYHGALGVLAIYNFLIFLSLRERSFFFYSLFASFMGLGMFALNGLMRQFVWPPQIPWSEGIHLTLIAFTIASAIYFTQSFLNTATNLTRLHWTMHGVAILALFQALAFWLGASPLWLAIGLSFLNLITAGFAIIAGVLSWRADNSNARLFLLAWGVLCVGAIIAALHNFGWVPSNPLTAYALQLSSCVEMLLLSFTLAERIRLERHNREIAQTEALELWQALVDSLRESEKRLEETVEVRTAELNRSLKNERDLLDRYVRFGALIAHEFRNPLAIIKSQLSLIEKEKNWANTQWIYPYLNSINAAANRLKNLFEDWLQNDRLRQTQLELNIIDLPLSGWLEDVVEDLRDCYSGRYIDLCCIEPLPDLQADEALLRCAIHNLIDNAIKYSPIDSTVEIMVEIRDHMVGIAVVNQGQGIPPEKREMIFTDYGRANTDRGLYGLGLGLALVKRVVDLHRGWIEFNSETPQGTVFCLWLPITNLAN